MMANVEVSREFWGGEMTLELIPGDSHSSSSEEAGASSGVGENENTEVCTSQPCSQGVQGASREGGEAGCP